ncbi:hypothetical protein NHX12_011045 [Muraenolepis orangiensis]|uniref:Uncharacterized protein n=1 Tax=Muraenolepis orangiensis TaxID=630683 RepID=A0A9Q0DH32_9TELE|nr:hypothetical protein NHX12_011045 [Muraenolepis orangiensis]
MYHDQVRYHDQERYNPHDQVRGGCIFPGLGTLPGRVLVQVISPSRGGILPGRVLVLDAPAVSVSALRLPASSPPCTSSDDVLAAGPPLQEPRSAVVPEPRYLVFNTDQEPAAVLDHRSLERSTDQNRAAVISFCRSR